MRLTLLVIALLLAGGVTLAADSPAQARYEFESEAKRERFWDLAEQLRCLVCQGESIAESNAGLAKDLREQVQKMLREGRSDEAIREFMVARYGDFVLFRPPVKSSTYVLWFGPFALMVVAVGGMLWVARKRAVRGSQQPDEALQQQARSLLDDDEDSSR